MLKVLLGEIQPSFCCLWCMLDVEIWLCCWCFDQSIRHYTLCKSLPLLLQAVQWCYSIGLVDASSWKFYPASAVHCSIGVHYLEWWSSIGEDQRCKIGRQLYSTCWSCYWVKSCLAFAVSARCWRWDSAVDAWTFYSCAYCHHSKLLNCVLQLGMSMPACASSTQLQLSNCLIGVHYLDCGGHQLELKKVNNTSLVSNCLIRLFSFFAVRLATMLKVLLGESSPAFAVSGVCSMLKMGLCCWCIERSIRHHTLCKPLPLLLLQAVQWCYSIGLVDASSWKFYSASVVHCSIGVYYLESGGHQLEKVNDTGLVGDYTATSLSFASAVWFVTMLKLLLGEVLPSFCCLWCLLDVEDGTLLLMLGLVYPCAYCFCYHHSKLLNCVLHLETSMPARASSIQLLLSSCLIGVHYLECGRHQLELEVNDTSLVGNCLLQLSFSFFGSEICHGVEGATGGSPSHHLLSPAYVKMGLGCWCIDWSLRHELYFVWFLCLCVSCLYLSICCPGEWPLSVSVYLLPWWVATVCICLSVALVSGHYLYLSICCPGEWHKRTLTLDWTSSCNALLSTRMSSTDQILHFQQVCVTGGGCMQHCRCIIANIGNVQLVSVRLHAMT